MNSRLDNLPVYETCKSSVRAEDFNLVKIALKRLCAPLRIEIPRLRTLDFIFDHDAWIIVDRSLNDIPVIAWLNFTDKTRAGLHEPVACERRSYHTHALIIIDKALEALQLMLVERLGEITPETNDKVIEMKKPS